MSDTGAAGAFEFRRMQPRDLPEVMEIERLSFSNPWHESTFRGELQNSPISFPIVAVSVPDGRVMGYIVFWKIQDDVQINNIAVRPEARRPPPMGSASIGSFTESGAP